MAKNEESKKKPHTAIDYQEKRGKEREAAAKLEDSKSSK